MKCRAKQNPDLHTYAPKYVSKYGIFASLHAEHLCTQLCIYAHSMLSKIWIKVEGPDETDPQPIVWNPTNSGIL